MALRNGSSVSIGTRDVAVTLHAFQELNSCILSLSLEATMRGGQPDLQLTATARTTKAADVGDVPLASYQFSLSQEAFRELDAAIMFALYRIDGLLAAAEFQKSIRK